ITSPAILNGIIYAGSSDGKFVQAIDISTGKEIWRTSRDGWFWSSPAVVEDTLYIGSGNQSLYALDLNTGSERWHFTTSGSIYSSPTVSDGVVYFGSDDGNLYALEGPSTHAAKKAVFWDERLIYKFFSGHQEVRDYLAGDGYKVLNVPELSAFLKDRVADKSPSVVVFAMDTVPFNLTVSGPNKDLIKQYLSGGGKIVWLGMPPTIFKKSPDSGQPYDYDKVNPNALFGFNYDDVDGDSYTVKATADGKKWGLQNWWAGSWSMNPSSVTTVL